MSIFNSLTEYDRKKLKISSNERIKEKYCKRCAIYLKKWETDFCTDCAITVLHFKTTNKLCYKLFSPQKGVEWFEINENRGNVIIDISNYIKQLNMDTLIRDYKIKYKKISFDKWEFTYIFKKGE